MKFSRIWDSGIRKVLYFFNTLPVMSDKDGGHKWPAALDLEKQEPRESTQQMAASGRAPRAPARALWRPRCGGRFLFGPLPQNPIGNAPTGS